MARARSRRWLTQPRSAPSDKRPAAIENASYRRACGVLAFGGLVSVACRAAAVGAALILLI